MNIQAIDSARGQVPAPLPRASRPPSRPFREALRETVDPARTVRRGDTLSHLVQRHLEATGQGTSRAAIYRGVAQVAEANGLRNPDLIFVGQRIDFSVLGAGQQEAVAVAPLSRPVAAVPPSRTPRPAAPVFLATQAPKTVFPDWATSPPKHDVAAIEPRQPIRAEAFRPWRRLLGASARLTSEYGFRNHPLTGQWHHHDGIDLAAERGTRIHSLLPGKVVFSGWRGGYGNLVVVRHAGGTETYYGHNATNLVNEGDSVSARAPLATVGATGRATGPHLHFEVQRNGRAVDPVPYVTGNLVTQVARNE